MTPTAEEFLDENFEDDYFQGAVFGDFAYRREVVIKAMEAYAKLREEAALKNN